MRARRRVILLATAALVLAPPASWAAGGDADAWTDVDQDDGGGPAVIEVGAVDGPPTGGGGGGGSQVECSLEAVPSEYWQGGSAPLLDLETYPLEEYVWHERECVFPDGSTSADLVPIPRPDPDPNPVALAQEATSRLELPTPTPAMNPPDEQVVHVETWLWVDGALWRPHTATATAGGVTASATAVPERVVWDLGNGDEVVCDGPGTPYDPERPPEEQDTDCSYVYRASSQGQPGDAYQVTATVEWGVTWTAAGAAGGGALPDLSTSTTTSVRVEELQALNE